MNIIFTNRPVSIFRPISLVNAITRTVTKSPFDHVALELNGIVYESTSGFGVRQIPFNEWIKDRVGSYLMTYYDSNDDRYNMDIFYELEGCEYDYKANFLYLFGLERFLSKKNNERQFCSELIARILGLDMPYHYTPNSIHELCSTHLKVATIDKIK